MELYSKNTFISQTPDLVINKNIYQKHIKRSLDFVLSLLALLVLWPVLLIVAILVRTNLGSPILFRQKRPGLDEKIFTLYKFRTMTDAKDENGNLLPNSVRLTKFGQILRATSLDELPELINILKGDMSIVGPRPLAVEYLPYYNEKEKLRHSVCSGLTGLAQINGRNNVNWDKRLAYDVDYVENVTFINDLTIIIKTISKVFKHEGVVVCGGTEEIDFNEYRRINGEKRW